MIKSEITDFVSDNRDMLDEYKNYSWPIVYNTIEELSDELLMESYNYYTIMASLGLNGWVVAREYKIIEG
ncbi:hypothetical protein [Paenibacillus sp. Marseille-Q7038]